MLILLTFHQLLLLLFLGWWIVDGGSNDRTMSFTIVTYILRYTLLMARRYDSAILNKALLYGPNIFQCFLKVFTTDKWINKGYR